MQTAIQGVHQHLVLVGDVATPDLVGAGEFAVIGIQLFVQHQKAADLAAREQVVHAQVGIDFFHAVLDQGVDLGFLRQVGIARIRQVVPLSPVAHGVKVNVDHDAHFFALVAIGHHLFDEGEELELVLHILGRKHGPVVVAPLDAAHVFDAVDDLEVAAGIQKPRIAGVVPTIGAEHLGGGFGVFVIALEQARRLDQDFTVVGHLDLYTRARHTHGIGARFVVGLQTHKHGGLGRAIQLFEVDADGAVKGEQIGANGLTGGIGHTHPRHAQVVAQRAVNQPVAHSVLQRCPQANGFAVHARRAMGAGDIHEVFEQAALDGTGIFHADHHAGEQALKHARRRKVIGGADLFEVDGHGGG